MRVHHVWPSFVDLLFGIIICFMALILLMATIISPSKKDVGAEIKAEFLITATWTEDCDVDLLMQDPDGNVVYFSRKETVSAHLEFDSRGKFNNLVTLQDGTKYVPKQFVEVLTLRSVIPGEYTFNVHLYGVPKGSSISGSEATGQSFPVDVEVKIQKLNPSISVVAAKTVHLTKIWEEQTAFRINIDSDKVVQSVNSLQKGLLQYR